MSWAKALIAVAMVASGCTAGTSATVAICGNGTLELDEACDDGNVVNGDGCNETCSANECGNGVLDLDEACDDGNAISGDGCSLDCTSGETCGNGILDIAAGEECDDGNTRNRDGCSSNCKPEQLTWREVVQTQPSYRFDAAMAYDVARQRIVMTSGSSFAPDQEFATWEFDGASWRRVARPSGSPIWDYGYEMVYDSSRARVVLFGQAETWEFDGVTWTNLAPTVSPPARIGHVMAYDAHRKRIVVFGGQPSVSSTQPLGDTWEFDGTTWTHVMPTTSPTARSSACAAYDPKRSKVVMFGGGDIDETWEYDGTTWTARVLDPHPPAMITMLGGSACDLVWDTARGKLVLFGGTRYSPQTWEYDGTAWALASPTGTPEFRHSYSAAYDQALKQTVMFGGYSPNGGLEGSGTIFGTTLLYDGTAWTSPPPETSPSGRLHSSIAYDVGTGKLVMFGGFADKQQTYAFSDTWQLDDIHWSSVEGAGPPARARHAMAYDPARHSVVLYGGKSTTVALADTWELNGTTWTERAIVGPGTRLSAAMAYDPDRSATILFGGADDFYLNNLHNDAWKLDATGWSPINTTTPPSPRRGHAMTYDASLGRCIMHGGEIDPTTYQLDSATLAWTAAPAGPSVPSAQAMAYDTLRKRVVLYDGLNRATWERSGTSWSLAPQLVDPFPLDALSMAYDIANGEIVFFGGYSYDYQNGYYNQTWRYGYVPRAAGEACRSGVDYDRDGKIGCMDDECWNVCTPLCPPGTTNCGTNLSCGDGICSAYENSRSCPTDCTPGPSECGDSFCDPGETNVTCPGDCP